MTAAYVGPGASCFWTHRPEGKLMKTNIKELAVVNKLLLYLVLVILVGCSSDEEIAHPTKKFEVMESSIASGDTVSPGSSLLIEFSHELDVLSLGAESIEELESGNPEILLINNPASMTLNGSPVSFYYDRNGNHCAFVNFRTAYNPEGTGEGFVLRQGQNIFQISRRIVGGGDMEMAEDYVLPFNVAMTDSVYIYPNPVGVNGFPRNENVVAFVNLPPGILLISIQNIRNGENIEVMKNEDQGHFFWEIPWWFENGLYGFSIRGAEYSFNNGVVVIGCQ